MKLIDYSATFSKVSKIAHIVTTHFIADAGILYMYIYSVNVVW